MIKSIGPHRVQCGNIMDGIDKLMGGDKADFIYSDPPWGQGNLRYWQTINKRHTKVEPVDIDYSAFLEVFFTILSKYARDVAVIEYGERWREDIVRLSQAHGFIHGGSCTSQYSGGKGKLLPLDIHVISKSGDAKIQSKFAAGCYNSRGIDVVKFIFSEMLPTDSKIVLDPMCGMGYTAQAALENGLVFYGNELNQKRLDKTIARLEKSQ